MSGCGGRIKSRITHMALNPWILVAWCLQLCSVRLPLPGFVLFLADVALPCYIAKRQLLLELSQWLRGL